MIGSRRKPARSGVEGLLAETQDLVGRLVLENRALKLENARLAREVTRLSQGWETLRKLARQAPGPKRSR